MKIKMFSVLFSTLLLVACAGSGAINENIEPLKGMNITVDPGHGNSEAYDHYRIGPTGEREEWINLRVAKLLAKKLNQAGANVLLTRQKDKDISLGGRAALAKQHQSDLLVSIHHNGSENDLNMDLPIVYFFGSAINNPASVDFAKILLSGMRDSLEFSTPKAGGVYSDHLIYSSGTSILRNSINEMPGVIGEAGFFTHPAGEKRLKSKAYNELEAEVYFQAILKYFDRGIPFAKPLSTDSLEFLDLGKQLDFKLNDGFGNNIFEVSSIEVLQDGKAIPGNWNTSNGILSVTPNFSENNKVTFQVFGRNLKGNAIHPNPFTFLTERGYLWYSEDQWQTAFNKAKALIDTLEIVGTNGSEALIDNIDESIHLLKLSLELQIVHEKALEAEKSILDLLILKQDVLEEDFDHEIADQRKRILEYYP